MNRALRWSTTLPYGIAATNPLVLRSRRGGVWSMEQGYIQMYTGNGKGKTTAALGISLRCVCAGKRVFFGQFLKDWHYSELKAGELLPRFEIVQFGCGCFIDREPEEEDYRAARKGLARIDVILQSGDYDLVVLDEINVALHYGLLDAEEVIAVLKRRDPRVEVVLTGRYAPQELIDFADLVTEMREVKHYYHVGVEAREGIER
jgi:cob(I)alamin adenosyltransferase